MLFDLLFPDFETARSGRPGRSVFDDFDDFDDFDREGEDFDMDFGGGFGDGPEDGGFSEYAESPRKSAPAPVRDRLRTLPEEGIRQTAPRKEAENAQRHDTAPDDSGAGNKPAREKLDLKKLVIYSEIMSPKYRD